MAARTGPTCGANRRNDAGPCGQPAGWHTDHPGVGRCSWHGGNAPNGRVAAARVAAETEAREMLARMDVEPVGNPLEALHKLGGQVIAWQETCARLVNRLTEEEVRYPGSLRGEQLRAEIGMYQDALRQSASVLATLAKLQIDERLTTIRERDAQMIASAFAAALARAQLGRELDEAVRMDFGARLRAIGADKTVETAEDDGALTGVVVPAARS